MYTLRKIMEARKDAVRTTYCLFDVPKVITQYGRMGCRKKCGKLESEEKRWGMMKNMTECATSAMMQTGKYSNTRGFALN